MTGNYLATACMFLIVLFLWRDLSGVKQSYIELSEQNQQLKEQNRQLKEQNQRLTVDLAHTRAEVNVFKTGDSASAKRMSSSEKTAKTIAEPIKEPETLNLQSPSVSNIGDDLVAELSFESRISELPDLLALVVRLPNSSEAVIRTLSPVNEDAFSNVKARVDGSGKFAIFQGSPSDLKALRFYLTVSEPVTATIRGSKGITPFEITITPDSPSVRNL